MSENFEDIIKRLRKCRQQIQSSNGATGHITDLERFVGKAENALKHIESNHSRSALKYLRRSKDISARILFRNFERYVNYGEQLINLIIQQASNTGNYSSRITNQTGSNDTYMTDNRNLSESSTADNSCSLFATTSALSSTASSTLSCTPIPLDNRSKIAKSQQSSEDKDHSEQNALNPKVIRMRKGNKFNRQNHHRHECNELPVTIAGTALTKNGYADPNQSRTNRVDSFDPKRNLVFERKFTQTANVKITTLYSYLRRMTKKYSPNRNDIVIANTAKARSILIEAGYDPDNFIGKPLSGKLAMEIPAQTSPPPLKFLKRANKLGVLVVDVEETFWYVSDNDVVCYAPLSRRTHIALGNTALHAIM